MPGTLLHDAASLRRLRLESLDRPAPAGTVLLSPPEHFQVLDVRNPYMEGNAGRVDRAAAAGEWRELRAALAELNLAIHELEPAPGLVDQVFTANPSLVGAGPDGRSFALVSRMRHPRRAAEPEVHAAWLERRGIPVHRIPGAVSGAWEGGGDPIWHRDRWFLWAGVGPRSDASVLAWIAERFDLPVAVLRLPDPSFYHLDTCFAVLDRERAAWVPEAFDEAGRDLLRAAFPVLLRVDAREARERLAANLYAPRAGHALLPAGAPRTREALDGAGIRVREVRTDEFLKSGGSVYCMLQELPGETAE